MKSLRERLGALLAADALSLAPATTGNEVHLIGSAFALSENLLITDLTLLTGNGLDPVICAAGVQEVALDPVTSEQIITLVPAAGSGFRWVTSGTITVPITVYGAALTDNAGGNLLAALQLPTPVVFHGPGYQLDLDPQTFTLVLTPIN
jgi:hypothetical protein